MAAGADCSIRDNFGIGPADHSHVQRVSKAMLDRAADHRRWTEMQTYLLASVPSHAEGPYAAANGPPLGPYGEKLPHPQMCGAERKSLVRAGAGARSVGGAVGERTVDEER
eukprot:2007819-Rhodomonas_salina.1